MGGRGALANRLPSDDDCGGNRVCLDVDSEEAWYGSVRAAAELTERCGSWRAPRFDPMNSVLAVPNSPTRSMASVHWVGASAPLLRLGTTLKLSCAGQQTGKCRL